MAAGLNNSMLKTKRTQRRLGGASCRTWHKRARDIWDDAWLLFCGDVEETPAYKVLQCSADTHNLSISKMFRIWKEKILFHSSEFVESPFKWSIFHQLVLMSFPASALCTVWHGGRRKQRHVVLVCVFAVCVCYRERWGKGGEEGGGDGGGLQTHRLITQHCRRSQRHCTLAASIQATTTKFCVKVITAWMQRHEEHKAEEGAGGGN